MLAEAEPEGGGYEAVCSKDTGYRRGVDWGGPTSIGEGNECQRRRWTPKGVDCEIPHRLGEENEIPFIRVWKHLPSRRVLKILRES